MFGSVFDVRRSRRRLLDAPEPQSEHRKPNPEPGTTNAEPNLEHELRSENQEV